jgi:hypothetical protein
MEAAAFACHSSRIGVGVAVPFPGLVGVTLGVGAAVLDPTVSTQKWVMVHRLLQAELRAMDLVAFVFRASSGLTQAPTFRVPAWLH